MNTDTYRFEPVTKTTTAEPRYEPPRAKRKCTEPETMVRYTRGNGDPVPENWPVFTVSEPVSLGPVRVCVDACTKKTLRLRPAYGEEPLDFKIGNEFVLKQYRFRVVYCNKGSVVLKPVRGV